MDWFYADNGQQRGPISETQLDELVRSGTINADTLVWRAGFENWQPLRTARPAISPEIPPIIPAPAGGDTNVSCVECFRSFPRDEMLWLNNSWVCARCKPIFLQRLMEGGAPARITGMLWHYNRQLVMRSDTPLPDRCVQCNAPANGFRLKRQLYWHPPLYYLLILISILVYAIVALIIRKKAVVNVGLCEQHRAQRNWFIAGAWFAAVGGLALLIAAIAGQGGMLALIGLVLLLVALVVGAVKGAVVSAAKIDKDFVWVKGTCQLFLADLPEWTGPR